MSWLRERRLLVLLSVLVVVLLVAVVLFVGCRREPATPEPPTEVATAAPPPTAVAGTPTAVPVVEDAWERIQSSGKMVVGTAADYPPFEYYTSDFRLDGFDIALMREIGRSLGVEVEFRDMAFDGLDEALYLNEIDAAISAISATPRRAESVRFSLIYLITEDAVVGQTGDTYEITSVRDLAPLRVGVQNLSVYQDWLEESLVETGLMNPANLHVYQNADDAVAAVSAGEIDVVVLDVPVAEVVAEQEEFAILATALNRQRMAVALARDDSRLQIELNTAINELLTTGRINQLATMYLGLEEDEIIDIDNPTPPIVPGRPVLPACIDSMTFVADITLDDNNMQDPPVLRPGTPFEKIWRVRNSGTCTWTPGYRLTYVGGNSPYASMGGSSAPIRQEVAPGATTDLSLLLVAPLAPGTYQGFWELQNEEGAGFGPRLWVGIRVEPLATATPPPTATPAADISFSASRTLINQGECTTLTWNVQNVQAVFLYPQGENWQNFPTVGSGTRNVCPNVTTTYELRVVRLDGAVELRQVRIEVIPAPAAPIIRRFTVEPPYQLFAGQCVMISWAVEGNTTNVRITRNDQTLQNGAPLAGSRQDCPPSGEALYGIEAQGPGGTTRAQWLVQVVQPTAVPPTPTPVPPNPPPVIFSFTVTPNQIQAGQCVNLYWNTGGGTSTVRLQRDGQVVLDNAPFNGQTQDCLGNPGTVTYLLIARNPVGEEAQLDASVDVTENQTANPLSNTSWAVTSINGQPVLESPLATVYFSPQGQVSGGGGCNAFNGTYMVNGNTLTIGPLAAGGVSCAPEVMTQEAAYFMALQSAATFTVDGATLTVFDATGTLVLEFIRTSR